MGKLLNLLTLVAVVYFVYWMFKRHFRHRKLQQQGIPIKQTGMRPITLFSIVLLGIYGAYMLFHFSSLSSS